MSFLTYNLCYSMFPIINMLKNNGLIAQVTGIETAPNLFIKEIHHV
jgi:hypothetical protein